VKAAEPSAFVAVGAAKVTFIIICEFAAPETAEPGEGGSDPAPPMELVIAVEKPVVKAAAPLVVKAGTPVGGVAPAPFV
jgi:hypothetical protein